MNVPATGREEAGGRGCTAGLSSDWSSGLPRSTFLLPVLNALRLNLSTSSLSTLCHWQSPWCVLACCCLHSFMAKRRAEDTLLHDSPSKRCFRSLCAVDMQLGSVAPTTAGGVSPPSLLALLGGRCRKRPYYFEDPGEQGDAAVYRKDTRKPAAGVLTVQTSGSFQDRRSCSTPASAKKRAREDCTGSEAVVHKAHETVGY